MTVKDTLDAIGLSQVNPNLANELVRRDEHNDRVNRVILIEFIIAFWHINLDLKNGKPKNWSRVIAAREHLPYELLRKVSKYEFKEYFDSQVERYEEKGATQMVTGMTAVELATDKLDMLKGGVKSFFLIGECSEESYCTGVQGSEGGALIDALIELGGLQDENFYDGRLNRDTDDE